MATNGSADRHFLYLCNCHSDDGSQMYSGLLLAPLVAPMEGGTYMGYIGF
ncbi:hypothetical protein GDO78_021044 [Eleutherodactylus coqui]|uniref:Uncharacterized protein n=1 Tax=Eleutherodactylus coqui TaxID=57060 RepID=A0A8J6E7D1_ELECQ|nr:hypothetical protein GDO78_021044 [Eleutherodactylus coqui]